jgi:hypothetical protein
MENRSLLLSLLVFCLIIFSSCTSGGGGTWVDEVRTLNLTFDGENCTYEGPTELAAGPVELFFHNQSDKMAAVNFLKHLEGKTIQDVIDYIGEEPSNKHAPSWTQELGTWTGVNSGDTHHWEGELEPGIYHMICARSYPFAVWFGTGLTVGK